MSVCVGHLISSRRLGKGLDITSVLRESAEFGMVLRKSTEFGRGGEVKVVILGRF